MNISQFFKICIVAGVVGTIFTGIIFMMSSSDDDQMRNRMRGVVNQFKVVESKPVRADPLIESPKDAEIQEIAKAAVTEAKPLPNPTVTAVKTVPQTSLTATEITKAPATVRPEVLRQLQEVKSSRTPSIHVFYYPWYENPEFNNGSYAHWNHEYLPNWDKSDKRVLPTGRHEPPEDIGSWFYPSLGTYSSRDPSVIDQHMKWMSSAGIDVVAVSWRSDEVAPNEPSWNSIVPTLLEAAGKYKLKICFHLEPYTGRTAESVRKDIVYLVDKYSAHPAFYKTQSKNHTTTKDLPLFYVYDSYLVSTKDWMEIAASNGSNTIRGTPYDSLLIGLIVKLEDKFELVKAGFDGLYTYFAAEGFSYGSTMTNWPSISTFCAKNGLLFIPSVGPGYIDTRVRAWNEKNTHDRKDGDYYREHFKMAHTAKADIVSITSFNEHHEGTGIEPVIDKKGNVTYLSFERPEQYLEITLAMVREYFTPHHETIQEKISRVV